MSVETSITPKLIDWKCVRTDIMIVREDFFQLADIPVLEALQDLHFLHECFLWVLGLLFALLRRGGSQLLFEDHLASIPSSRRLAHRLHDRGEGSLAELFCQLIVSIQAASRRACSHMPIDVACKNVQPAYTTMR